MSFYVGEFRYVIPIFYSFWLPQIIHNAIIGSNVAFTTEFIIATTVVKMLFLG